MILANQLPLLHLMIEREARLQEDLSSSDDDSNFSSEYEVSCSEKEKSQKSSYNSKLSKISKQRDLAKNARQMSM